MMTCRWCQAKGIVAEIEFDESFVRGPLTLGNMRLPSEGDVMHAYHLSSTDLLRLPLERQDNR